MTVRPSIALWRKIDSREIEILLMHYRYNGHDVYALPGGNPDRGETLTQTLKRELMEELGIEITIDSMVLCGEVIQPEQKDDVLHPVFWGQIQANEPTLNPAQTTALVVVWKPVTALKSLNLYPNVGDELHRWFVFDTSEPGYIGKIKQPFF
jgi:8-oxo-dGTP diphosphatase